MAERAAEGPGSALHRKEGPARAEDGCSAKAPRRPKAPRPPFPPGPVQLIPCAGISWSPGQDSLPTEHPMPAASPAPSQGTGWDHILCSPASCSPRPGWSSGAAGPPGRSGASCSGSQGSRSQSHSAKQYRRGKAGLRLPGERDRSCVPALAPQRAQAGCAGRLAASGHQQRRGRVEHRGQFQEEARGCMAFGGQVAFGARLHHPWVTATVSIALRMLSACPDPHIIPSHLHFAMVPHKPAQEPGRAEHKP